MLDGPIGAAPGAFQVGIDSSANLADASRVRGGTLTTTLVEQRILEPKVGNAEIRYVPGVTKPSRAVIAGLTPELSLFNPLSVQDGIVSGLVDFEIQPETVTIP